MINPLNYITKYVSPTVLKNSGWLIFDKVLAALISFIVYFITANYFGPEILGQYNYALSVVTIFATFGTLGLDSLIVRDFVNGKYLERNVLGSVFILRCIGSVLVTLISVLVVIVSKHDVVISLLTIILASVYILRSFQVLDSWFLAKKDVKPSVIARNVGALLAAVMKILVVLLNLNVIFFAVATTMEFIIAVITLITFYKLNFKGNIFLWRFDKKYIVELFKNGWSLILAALFAAFASRFDQYLLGTLKGDFTVGIYSPAAKISEFWYYIPLAFLDSVYPVLIEAKKVNEEKFYKKFEKTVSFLFYISLIFCIFISLGAKEIIKIFLNSNFTGADSILKIYVWGTFGTVMTSVLLRWLIIFNKQGQILWAHLINFVSNLLLNLYLIRYLGAIGAAWATAISYNLAWIVVCFGLNYKVFSKLFREIIVLPFILLKDKIRTFLV